MLRGLSSLADFEAAELCCACGGQISSAYSTNFDQIGGFSVYNFDSTAGSCYGPKKAEAVYYNVRLLLWQGCHRLVEV
jgi:hypothetical protein